MTPDSVLAGIERSVHHPAFVVRGSAAVPIRFVSAATWREHRASGSTRAARAFADAAGFEPRPGQHLLLPGADGAPRRRAVRRRGRPTQPARSVPARAARRRCCRPATIASPMRRTIARARRARLRARPYRFDRYRKAEPQGPARCCPTASTATDLTPHRRGRVRWRATSSTRRPTTWARPSSRRPRARSPTRHGATVARRSSATTCWRRIFR